MKRDLAPMLFKDDDPAAAAAQRSSPVGKAKVSPAARENLVRRRDQSFGKRIFAARRPEVAFEGRVRQNR
jgi:hypothetical protein